MRALEWHRFLSEQHKRHAKVLFTVTELANVADTSPRYLNVELSRLRRQGVIVKYAHGLYGLPDAVTVEALVAAIDAHAYVTGFYALYRHNLVTQAPTRIMCFTNRYSPRGRERTTPVGRLVFVCVRSQVYNAPPDGTLASAEAALCDLVFLAHRRGVNPESQVTFRGLTKLNRKKLNAVLVRYSQAVQAHVRLILADRRICGDGFGAASPAGC